MRLGDYEMQTYEPRQEDDCLHEETECNVCNECGEIVSRGDAMDWKDEE